MADTAEKVALAERIGQEDAQKLDNSSKEQVGFGGEGMEECLQHIDQLNVHRKNIEAEILRLAEPDPYQLELLRTVPGFSASPATAVALISEIGVNMSVFLSAKHLVSGAGCCPRNAQSNNKVKSTRISRAGGYLKPLLVQVANVVIKSDKYPEWQGSLPQNQGSPWSQESDYRCVQDAPDRYLECPV